MDRERLTELLQDPALVAREDLGDLRSLTGRFPWFSGAHLLLAVGEHAQGDVLSNDPVRTPAAYLPSRAVLFDLIQAEAAPAPPPMHVVKDFQLEPPLAASQPVALPKVGAEKPFIVEGPPPVAEETRPILPDASVEAEAPSLPVTPEEGQPCPPPTAAPDVPAKVAEGLLEAAEEPRSIIPDNEAASSGSTTSSPAPSASPSMPDSLDSQMREAIMAGGYDLAHIPAIPVPATSAAPPLATAPAPSPSMVGPEAPEAPPVQPAARITRESRLRFTDWLSASSEAIPEPMAVPTPDISAEEAPSAPALDRISPLAGEALPDPKEIIERFIQQTSPPAAPVKAEFFTPQQAAKRSLMDDGLVSETLAKVYEQQGDMAKAKATYARLAIIHPEKSVYFAALSKALEGRSNK